MKPSRSASRPIKDRMVVGDKKRSDKIKHFLFAAKKSKIIVIIVTKLTVNDKKVCYNMGETYRRIRGGVSWASGQ